MDLDHALNDGTDNRWAAFLVDDLSQAFVIALQVSSRGYKTVVIGVLDNDPEVISVYVDRYSDSRVN